ncbi:hypothetical protein Bca4012_024709 [Brassica carinata]|uniref:S-protein homolog n=1 Tax=Brassica carinata TaxID=52824 RepID=A0A8X8ASE2_BRACI|nr:hypothetical protein Bca52824_021765 [Brassica carinata]
MKLFIIALIVLGVCIEDTFGKNSFGIVNKFRKRTKLSVNCGSGNDKFPILFLMNGEEKHWRFDDAFFHETLFKCELRYGYHFMHRQEFKAYSSKWNDSLKNKSNATWLAAEKGIYKIWEHRAPEFMYRWL